jgi:predicted N-formylglutamate amidohydrolase
MVTNSTMTEDKTTDSPAVWIENEQGKTPVLLTCEHATNIIPEQYNKLGLDDEIVNSHRAYDIGSLELTRHMSKTLDAPAIFAGYSRLLVDINRDFDHPELLWDESDNVIIPGNKGLSQDDIKHRIDTYYMPFHSTLEGFIDSNFINKDIRPAIVSVHSFNRTHSGQTRPWDASVGYIGDNRELADPFLDYFRSKNISVGDNEPYDLNIYRGVSVDLYGFSKGLPSLVIEICNDLLETEDGQKEWAEHCCAALPDFN